MQGMGRKNAAGSWLRWEMLRRIFSVSMLAMAVIGFGLGFTLRGLPILDALDGTIAIWGMIAVMALACGALFGFGRYIESTWRAGWARSAGSATSSSTPSSRRGARSPTTSRRRSAARGTSTTL